MQISARYQAVFEVLTEALQDIRPVDNILQDYFRARRYIGSKDRRFIADVVWDIIRKRMRLSFEAKSGDARRILLTYLKDTDLDIIADGSEYGLAALSKDEKNFLKNLKEEVYPPFVENECPEWLYQKINHPRLVQSLNAKAPADLRANLVSREEAQRRLRSEGLFFSFTPYAPFGLRSEERVHLNNSATYQEGLVEVQDEASQLAAWLCGVREDEKVVDYCAGAGGKSLAIAAYNRNEGQIFAHDANWNRMDVIKSRAERLGVRNIKLIKALDGADYDCFIVDAPCSGSGTWRRSPDAKFRLTEAKLADLTRTQTEILETAYQHTKKGGRIVYMTCSVLDEENTQIVSDFVLKHPDVSFAHHQKLWAQKVGAPYPFETDKYLSFSPLVTGTDGFFFCMLYKM